MEEKELIFYGPFFGALLRVRDRISRLADGEELIQWEGSNDASRSRLRPVPSLEYLSLQALAQNAGHIMSLGYAPDSLGRRLGYMICNLRKMDIRIFELFVGTYQREIRVKDCSLLTGDQVLKTLRNLNDPKSLKVLQLEQCTQFAADTVIKKALAWYSNSLPSLRVISLEGACQLSPTGLKALVMSAPALSSVNLSHCALLTNVGIKILANSLKSTLRELNISYCPKIDAMDVHLSLMELEHLEALSVAGIYAVCDRFVSYILCALGHNIKKLDFADCPSLTKYALQHIAHYSRGLLSLNLSNLVGLPNMGLEYLGDGCRRIETLKLCANRFSDDTIAAFLEASGQSLKELSLNHVKEVGSQTAYSIAKYSTNLLSLDLSGCKKITDQALGLIVDSCKSLKLLKLFCCTQITDVFLNRHTNPMVHIVGLQSTSSQDIVSHFESSEDFLEYSPLKFLSDDTDRKNSGSSEPVLKKRRLSFQ
ncbi:DNA repair protein rhp7-like [Coffea arabica]|uniref:DNA repair protein rhp7-like n=1 Tax=Coffea arabica TaxID=13443 RepID=A0ABM4VF83_COFAR